MQLNPSEISDLIKAKIQNLAEGAEVRTKGTVISVTDGIVRIHGLADVMQGEMLEFPGNTFGLAMNLERDSVGAVVLASTSTSPKATKSSVPVAFWKCRLVRNWLAAWSTPWVSRSTARARSTLRNRPDRKDRPA
ncbi:ATP synthase subunit alpha [Chromobacterium violaceum]|uniref:ATP synthase subunit alpha n=1 Tax=Chromobacterium violaceum TaxID=536 RepID=A0A447T6M2_CHRVL|nr:ATP synthase subunit alpha [Chromobacterium violaceum]